MGFFKSTALGLLLATSPGLIAQTNFSEIVRGAYGVVESFRDSENSDSQNVRSLKMNSLDDFDYSMKKIPQFNREDALKIEEIYRIRLIVNLQSYMDSLGRDPLILSSLSRDYLISDLENAKRWSEIVGRDSNLLSDLEKKVSLISYETQMAIAEDYISKQIYPLGVLQAYSLASQKVLDCGIVSYSEHLERSRKGLDFVKVAYFDLDKNSQKLLTQEARKLSNILSELRKVSSR